MIGRVMRYIIFLIILFYTCTGDVSASSPPTCQSTDTLKTKASQTAATLLYLPDSLIRDTLKYEYSKIKQAAGKTRLTKELYKMIFVDPKPGRVNIMRTQNSEEPYRQYKGKIIRKIDIIVLPPYGHSVYDTTWIESDIGRLKKIANDIHLRTAERTVKRQITLQEGMTLSPFEIVQNEILLRDLPYIDDAAIWIDSLPNNSNYVDITVVCKDEFSWGGEIATNFLNSARIGVENKNFMRWGHVVNYELSYRGTKEKKWGNSIEYQISSILGSHLDFNGFYQNDYRDKLVRLEVDKQFLTSQTRWAGGVAYERVFYSDDLPDRNISRLDEPFNFRAVDAWSGRSFSLAPKYNYNRNFYVTTRFFNTTFRNRPIVSVDTNQFYYNRNSYFLAFAFTKIRYYKANLIYDFGRTEDIPTGLYLATTMGFENNEYQNSAYIGIESCYSFFNKHSERFYSVEAAIGSYINEWGFERGVIKVGLNHISNLCTIGTSRFRFYNRLNYIVGIKRYPSDNLYFQDYDIGGFRSDTLSGNQKLSGSIAATLFLPFIKKGFRASVTVFSDAGAIAPRNESIFSSKTYWGMGVALNIRNDNIVFKNISIRLAFYPRVPSDARSFQASITGNPKDGFYDYRVYKPRIIEYK